jgi:hypothetical protein
MLSTRPSNFSTNHGWMYIHIEGAPYDRGYVYGQKCAKAFQTIQHMLSFYMIDTYGFAWSTIYPLLARDFLPVLQNDYSELHQEMQGITDGVNANSTKPITTLEEILAWNLYCSLPYWISSSELYASLSSPEPGEIKHRREGGGGGGGRDRCSAFMAVGSDWTEDGRIVCGHNSFSDFIDGQYSNVILSITPHNGHRMLMQTSPCWIWSGTDFFVTSAGIVGTETTFGGFFPYQKKHPICFRIRRAMQYATTLDEYATTLIQNNSGDYANAWMLGHVRDNEIMRLELGLQFHQIDRTHNGYFIGFNAPYNACIRNLEVQNSGFDDIRRHQGARHVRLEQLMQMHAKKINTHIAQVILADHYDVYLQKKNHPCSRTVCAHYELDAREYMSQADRPKPYAPRGAVDGIVCDSRMVEHMAFQAKFGCSCSHVPFDASDYFQAHPQYARYAPYIQSRPIQPWVVFQAHQETHARPWKEATPPRIQRAHANALYTVSARRAGSHSSRGFAYSTKPRKYRNHTYRNRKIS